MCFFIAAAHDFDGFGADNDLHRVTRCEITARQGSADQRTEHSNVRCPAGDRRYPSRDEIHASDELGHELRCRAVVEILGGSFLDDAALVHHGDPVGYRHRFFLIVGHVHGRDREPALQVANFLAHLDPQFRIEIG